MRQAERVGVETWFDDGMEQAIPGFSNMREEEVRTTFIEFLRREAHGVIWPSVVAKREVRDGRTRISVRALAFRSTAGGAA